MDSTGVTGGNDSHTLYKPLNADVTEASPNMTNDDMLTHPDFSVGRVFIMILQILLIAINVFGNGLVIVIFLKTQRIREKIFNWYIFNLAIADFIVTLDMLTNFLKWYYGRWPLGGRVCTTFMVFIYTAIYMSAVMITIMSFDRYLRICKPIRYRLLQTSNTSRLALKVILAGIWIVVFTFYSIFGYGWTAMTGEKPLDYSILCEMQYVENKVMNFLSLALEFFVPILLLCCFNIIVYIQLHKQMKIFQKTRLPNSPAITNIADENQSFASDDSTVNPEDSPSRCSPKLFRKVKLQHMPISREAIKYNFTKKRGKELQQLRRSAIFLAMYVVVFILCWLPYYIMILANTFCSSCHITVTLYITILYILDINSVLNPILYSISNRHFRKHAKEFLEQIFCCRRIITVEKGYRPTGATPLAPGSQRSTVSTASE